MSEVPATRKAPGRLEGGPPYPGGIPAGSGVSRVSWSHLNEASACSSRPFKDTVTLPQALPTVGGRSGGHAHSLGCWPAPS